MRTGIINRLQSIAENNELISYRDFIKEILFAPEIGYYTKKRNRVGKNVETDFYTAEFLGEVFRKLILASIKTILDKQDLKMFTFVEIGAEPGQGLFENISHPFQEIKTIRANEEIEIPEKAIVFANELLDAQPFHRLIYENGQWRELGVKIHSNDSLEEKIMPKLSPEIENILKELPNNTTEGYQLDFPLDSEKLLEKIVQQNWNGLVMLFDYGLSWDDLIYNRPEGTARAYYKHKQHNNLLTNIGDQDITCHICWDRLHTVLKKYAFKSPTLQRQESFFVHNATSAIETIIKEKSENKLNHDRQTLHELIHPAHMGHKFQVLWAMR